MKILIIRNYPSYMDVKYNTYNIQEIGLAKALIRKGNVCDIVFWTDSKEETIKYEFDGDKAITIYYLGGKDILKNAVYKNLNSIIDKYDIIQPSEYNQLQSWLLAKKYPKKTIIYHGPYYCDFNKRYNLICKATDLFMLRAYKKHNTPFLVKSNLAKDFLVSKGIAENRITVSGVGVDLDTFNASSDNNLPDEIKKVSELNSQIKLLYIGKIEPRRNPEFLLEVLREIRSSGVDASLTIVGNGDSDYVDKIFCYADTLKIRDCIYHIKAAEQKNLSYIYKNSDVFLLPTRYEIFGMVLLEAMFFGKPVITTYNGGSDILIKSGENGIVIKEFDKYQWAEAIKTAVSSPAIGSNAKKAISESYTWDALADKFIDAYNNI